LSAFGAAAGPLPGKRLADLPRNCAFKGAALGYFPRHAEHRSEDPGGNRVHLAAHLIRALVLLLAAAAPAAAQTAADLALVLAVDASGSVDQVRFELQKRGYVAAFRHPHVLAAIRSGPQGAIAVTMVQWTGPALQVQVAPWTRIGDEATAAGFAGAIERVPRQLFGGGTSISGAIDYGAALFRDNPFRASRRVIDVSGDGSNNRGRSVTLARDEAVAAGIAINGLPILALEPDLDRYYYDSVIGGPGAFVVAASNYETFADAILKKLITEIASRCPMSDVRCQTKVANGG
jgi:hypothetical protein